MLCRFYFWIAGHLISIRCIPLPFFHFLYVQTSLVIDDTDIKQKTSNILCLGENVVDIHGTINSSIC